MVTLYNGGDFWVVNDGANAAVIGQKAYANFADGKVSFAATGTPTTGATSTSSTIAPETFSVTGSILGDVLTVTAVGSGTVIPGAPISGTNIVSGTRVGQQLLPLLSGESLGGIGRYYTSIGGQNAVSTTVSGTYGLLTIGGTVTGIYAVGNVISGSGITAGTKIIGLGTGLGQGGTYYVDLTQTVNSGEAINVSAVNVETKWYAMSAGAPGQLIKISDHPLG